MKNIEYRDRMNDEDEGIQQEIRMKINREKNESLYTTRERDRRQKKERDMRKFLPLIRPIQRPVHLGVQGWGTKTNHHARVAGVNNKAVQQRARSCHVAGSESKQLGIV